MKLVIVGASSLLGHHLIDLLARENFQIIAFLPEDEALWFMQKYPNANFSFPPLEPATKDAVEQFHKLNPGIDNVVILGPHEPPHADDLKLCDKNYDFGSWGDDPTVEQPRDAFFRAKRRSHIWQVLDETRTRRCVLQSTLNACDADDKVFAHSWKRFTDRDICIVSYPEAIATAKSAARYTDAMVEHHFYGNCRNTFNMAVVLCTAQLTGPGIQPCLYREHDQVLSGGDALFIDVRDAARAFRSALARPDVSRNLVAQGPWNPQVFDQCAQKFGLDLKSGVWGCDCDTYDYQQELGFKFRQFEESIKDTFSWLAVHKDLRN